MAQCSYWNVNFITFQWFTLGLFSKYTKKVNICTSKLFYFSFQSEGLVSRWLSMLKMRSGGY